MAGIRHWRLAGLALALLSAAAVAQDISAGYGAAVAPATTPVG